jgi:hypothetical protein
MKMNTLTPTAAIIAALSFVAMPLSAPGAAQGATPASTPGSNPAKPTGFPFGDEDLNYSINWPSGISLGEAHLHAKHAGADWNFGLNLEAGVPGYTVKDTYHSNAVADFCSASFERTATHGSRATQERETVDRDHGTATRLTLSKDGGKSEIPVPACVKDALTYLFYSRRELGQGRVPAAQQILFGGLYEIRVDYTGAPMIAVGENQVQSDKVTCTIKAGSSEYKIDMYFARDPARTPLLVTTPLTMGKFSMELIR